MFSSLRAISPFTFSFSAGIVKMSGSTYTFDLNKCAQAGLTDATHLLHCLYEDFYKTHASHCCISGCTRLLGVQWDTFCLQQTGYPNLLSTAGNTILPQIKNWSMQWQPAPTPSPIPAPIPAPIPGPTPTTCPSGMQGDPFGRCFPVSDGVSAFSFNSPILWIAIAGLGLFFLMQK